MKAKIFLCILMLMVLNTGICKSQHVFPSYTDSPLWRSMICSWVVNCHTDSLFYDYDTTFCGHTYSRISSYWLAAYCRSDSLKTYVRTTTNCSDREYLMYDYSMNIGDTVHVGYSLFWNADSAKMTLSSIDTVVYFGFARRRFHMLFDPNQPHATFLSTPMTWIEGIGSDWHPFYPLQCLHDGCESTYALLCYDSMATQLYQNPLVNTCYYVTAMAEHDNMNTLNIYPNPVIDELYVSGYILNEKSAIEIYNTLGEMVLSTKPAPGSGKEIIINVSDLSKGIYICRVVGDGIDKSFKFIK